jgi:GH15 family glucan-1,4-alpha-glucosidase
MRELVNKQLFDYPSVNQLSTKDLLTLLSEEYDPRMKRLLGNFPQAFSHVALINTAWNLSQARGPAADRQQS